MAQPPLQLEGIVEADDYKSSDPSRREVQRLEDEVRSLRRELEDAERENARLTRSIENLRRILAPLHGGLRALFGEIELAVGEAPTAASGAIGVTDRQPSGDPRWESYKRQFPGVPSEIIDALLIHGDMKITNLSKLIKRHYETTRKAAYKLRDAGAITLAGGSLNLKR